MYQRETTVVCALCFVGGAHHGSKVPTIPAEVHSIDQCFDRRSLGHPVRTALGFVKFGVGPDAVTSGVSVSP